MFCLNYNNSWQFKKNIQKFDYFEWLINRRNDTQLNKGKTKDGHENIQLTGKGLHNTVYMIVFFCDVRLNWVGWINSRKDNNQY